MSENFSLTTQDPRYSSQTSDKDTQGQKKTKKSTAANLSNEQEQQVMAWLKDTNHDLVYNKRCRDYKNSTKRALLEPSEPVAVPMRLSK